MDWTACARNVNHCGGGLQVGNPQSRLCNPHNDGSQFVSATTPRLKHPAIELYPMSHTGIFHKSSLLWRTAHGQRLHAQPTRSLSEVAYCHYVIDNPTEEIDVIAVRVEIGCAYSLKLAVL